MGGTLVEYALLNGEDQRGIRLAHVRDLEAAHYRLILEESEEPGANPARTEALADIERRVVGHLAVLTPKPEPEPEPMSEPVDEVHRTESAPPMDESE
jgi:hypothetical protein